MKKIMWAAVAAVMAVTMASCGSAKKVSKQNPFDGVGIVAHRGYWNCEAGGFARNSVAALKAAQDAGFWGSEFDVNMTSDEVLLVFHDSSIEGKRIDGNPYATFRDFRLENGEPIPTLDAFLTQAEKCKTTKLVFELKKHTTLEQESRAIELSLQKLKAHGLLSPDRVVFISFSPHACVELARLCPGYTVQYLDTNLTPEELNDMGINGVDLNEGPYMRDAFWHKQARERGMSINVWTVNDPSRMKEVVSTGIDLLTTDEPLKARGALGEMDIKEVKN